MRGEAPTRAPRAHVPRHHVAVAVSAEAGNGGSRTGVSGRTERREFGAMGKGWGWAHPERTQGWPSIVANDTLWTSAPCPRSTTGSGAGFPIASRAPNTALGGAPNEKGIVNP